LTEVIDFYIVIPFISVNLFSGPNIWVWNRVFPNFFEEKSDYFNALFGGAAIYKARAFTMRRNGMTKDPVADFWGNIECALDESSFRYIIEDLIAKVRKQLDDSSMTAQAIDRSDSCNEIAAMAQKDGLEDFALALRFATD
jgi:hypothetical protein